MNGNGKGEWEWLKNRVEIKVFSLREIKKNEIKIERV